MTCIVGCVADGTVHLGGDSAGISGWSLSCRADTKVFRNGPYVMGFTASFRMGQLLRHALTPPLPQPGENLSSFMVTTFVDAVRACLKEGGVASEKNSTEAGGTFLVGLGGRLFRVGSDYQVVEQLTPFDAVGCGADLALGALHALTGQKIKPRTRLRRALSAAEAFSAGVRRPFRFVSGSAVTK